MTARARPRAIGRTADDSAQRRLSASAWPRRGRLAVAARYLARRAHRGHGDGLVDWRRAEQIAVRRLRAAPGALSAAELRAARPAYDSGDAAAIVPLLERRLGHAAAGRRGASRGRRPCRLGARQPGDVPAPRRPPRAAPPGATPADSGFAAGVAQIANRFLTTQQVGFLLGYLGTRVLGQYDIALLSAEAKPGRLLFVEENIRATATALDVPLDDFRIWIALHETTHAFEFEAHPGCGRTSRAARAAAGGLPRRGEASRRDGVAQLVARLRDGAARTRSSASCRPSSASCCARRSS